MTTYRSGARWACPECGSRDWLRSGPDNGPWTWRCANCEWHWKPGRVAKDEQPNNTCSEKKEGVKSDRQRE